MGPAHGQHCRIPDRLRSPLAVQSPAAKPVLYWKDPDGKSDFSPEPKKTADGRDYLPVYEGEEAVLQGGAKPARQQVAGSKILYYRNPMGLADVSPVPKKDFDGDGLRPRL